LRVTQERLQPGCFWALALGWAALTWAFPDTGVLAAAKFWMNVTLVVVLVLLGVFAMIEQKAVGDSTLVIDGYPEPGQVFHARIETTLSNERTSPFNMRLEVGRPSRRRGTRCWWAKWTAKPVRGERGLVLPVEFTIPDAVDAEDCPWSLVVRSWSLPMPYLATFVLPRTPSEQ
jgi:hypothetical protein